MGAAVDIGVLTQEMDDARQRKLAAADALQQARDAFETARTAEALARQAYEERIASVPENLRQHDALQAEIEATTTDFDSRKRNSLMPT
ncbi:MAG: hypothetical protein V4521_13880 [Pseudomonadota bacterium]